MGLDVRPVHQPFAYRLPEEGGMNSCSGFGVAEEKPGIYKSYVPAIDEGWSRWILEHEHFKYYSLEDAEIRSGNLHAKYNSILIPDQTARAILSGHRTGTMPPEYTGGLGQQGVKALREFVEEGGTIVCLNRASDFAIEQFKLPVRNMVKDLTETQFFAPGSILRIEVDTFQPLAQGMPRETIAWVEDSPVFEVIEQKDPDKMSALPASNIRIVARYPTDKNPLLSGWLLGGNRIKGKAALVEVTMGKGRIILFGFRPQYRGQSLATYPLFFNAISRQN
jgi:hypothetical protein